MQDENSVVTGPVLEFFHFVFSPRKHYEIQSSDIRFQFYLPSGTIFLVNASTETGRQHKQRNGHKNVAAEFQNSLKLAISV